MTQPDVRAYSQPLSVICLACAEQCFHRVITGDEEACEVDQKLSRNVEED